MRFGLKFGIILGAILLPGLLSVCGASLPATYSANLAWNPSSSPEVTGYRVYYGPTSGNYSNSVTVGNATRYSIPGLAHGVRYFFAVVAYTASGVESVPSNEVSYTPGLVAVQIRVATNRWAMLTVSGQVAHTYEIQASPTLVFWNVIATVTLGTNGPASFTDTNAPNFPRRFYRARDLQP